MTRTKTVMKEAMLKAALKVDETATLETLVGLLTVCGSRMTSRLCIYRTGLSKAIMVTISDAVTYNFDDEEEFQKFLMKKSFVKFDTEKAMYQEFLHMDDETWEEWNKGM